VVSSMNYQPTGDWDKYTEIKAPVIDPGGKHDLYFVFTKNGPNAKNLGNIAWVRFEGGNEKVEKEKPQPVPKAAAKKNAPVAQAGKQPGSVLITKFDCAACHSTDKKIIGPSYIDVAKRYKNDAATISKLADKIISGGAGEWGTIPMVPHPQLSKNDAASIVKYILSLKR
jgi:cytochrome c